MSTAKKPLSELAPPLFAVVKTMLAKEIDPGPRFLAEPLLEGRTAFGEEVDAE